MTKVLSDTIACTICRDLERPLISHQYGSQNQIFTATLLQVSSSANTGCRACGILKESTTIHKQTMPKKEDVTLTVATSRKDHGIDNESLGHLSMILAWKTQRYVSELKLDNFLTICMPGCGPY